VYQKFLKIFFFFFGLVNTWSSDPLVVLGDRVTVRGERWLSGLKDVEFGCLIE